MSQQSAKALVSQFPAIQREVMMRCFIKQESPADTCAALNITPETYNELVAKSLRALRHATNFQELFSPEVA